MRTWESAGPGLTYVCEVSVNGVCVGETRGNPHTDVYQSCSHREFLDGRFQGSVRSAHGEKVLEEVIAEVRGWTGPDPS
ncbi:MAG: hypothetical protein H6719_19260 [Sandaracinaceae bacterium]|nr:hypothetical protein [Sandaracinaceae bacterium]